ncbi:Hypothetical protein, putative [Bodo saltans]|uniref:Uncharacterized protein n=1 Tax=Bodo saltans TaxID=75058 RepID=A0A0S4JBA2_BODSA|nr:Hypothetical protein, putative [Bodo saltans]|eukprot:CUG87487.1 Hypothetical protein, putative [Bodo saltans]
MMYSAPVSNILSRAHQSLNDGQQPPKTAAAYKPPPQHPHLITIAICAVVLASLVAGTTAVPIQPTFDAARQSTVSATGTYVVDGLSTYSNGTLIFPDLTKSYSLTINVQGTVSLTVQGGLLLEVVAIRATTLDTTVTAAANVSLWISDVANLAVEITDGGIVRTIQADTGDTLQTLVVNADSSFIGSATQDFLQLSYAPSCITTLNLVNTSNPTTTAHINSLVSSDALGGLTVTITEGSQLAFTSFLTQCQSCSNVAFSILKGSNVTVSNPWYAGLYVALSTSVSVTVDNSTVVIPSYFILASGISAAVSTKISNNASVTVSEVLYALSIGGSTNVVIDNSTVEADGGVVVAISCATVSVTVRNETTITGYMGYSPGSVLTAETCSLASVNISDSTVTAYEASYFLDVVTAAISIHGSAIATYVTPCQIAFTIPNTTAVVGLSVVSSNFTSSYDSSLLTLSNIATFPVSPASSFVIQSNSFVGAWSSLLATNIVNYSVTSGQYLTTTISSNTINSVYSFQAFAFVEGWPRQGLTVTQNSAQVVVRRIILVDTAMMNNFPVTQTKLFVVGNNVTAAAASSSFPALQAAGSGCTTVNGDSAATAICWNTVVIVSGGALQSVVLFSNAYGNHASSLLADNIVNINSGAQNANPVVMFFPTMTITTRVSVFRNVISIGADSTVAYWSLFDNLNTTVAMTVVGSALMSFPTSALSSTLCNSYSSSTASTVLCANAVNLAAGASLVVGSVIRNSSIGTLGASLVFDMQAAPTNQISASIGQFDFFYLSNATSFTVNGLTFSSQLSATIRLLRSSLVLGAVSAQSLSATFTDTSSAGVNFGFVFIEDLKYSTALTMSSLSISMNTLQGSATAAICLKCYVKDNVAVKSNTISITNSPLAVASIAGIIFGTLPLYDNVPTASQKTGAVTGNLLIVAPTNVNPSGSASCTNGASICGNTLSLKGTGVSNVTVCPGCGTQDANWTVTVSNNVFGIQNTPLLVTVALCPGCIAWNGLVRVLDQNFTVTGTYEFMMNFGGLDVKNGTGVVQWNQMRASPANVSQILDAGWFGSCTTNLSTNVSAICGNTVVANLLSVDREIEADRFNRLILQNAGAVFCSGCAARENATLSVVNNYFESFNTTGAHVVVCDDCHATGENMPVDTTNSTALSDGLVTTWNLLTVSNNTVITRKGPPSANYVPLYGSQYIYTVYASTAIYKHNITLCSRCTAANGGNLQLFSNTYTHLLDDGRYDNFSSYHYDTLQINQINVTFCHQCNSSGADTLIALYNNTATAEGQYFGGMRGCSHCVVNESGRIIVATNLITVAGGYGTVDVFNSANLTVGANTTMRIVRNYKNTFQYNYLSDMKAQLETMFPVCDEEFIGNPKDSFICGNVFASITSNYYYTPTWFNFRSCTFCNASHPELTNATMVKNRELIIANNSWTTWYPSHKAYFGEQCAGNVWMTLNTLTSNYANNLDFSFCENCTVSPSANSTNIFRVEYNTVTGVAYTSTVALASYKSHHGVIVCQNNVRSQYYSFQAPLLVDQATQTDVVCIIPNSTWSHTTNNTVLITSSGTASQILCRGCFTRGFGSIQVQNHTFLATVYNSASLTLCMNCHVSVNGELLILNNIFYTMYTSTVNIAFNNQMNSQSSHRAINNEILSGSYLEEIYDSGYDAIKEHREDLLTYCLSRTLDKTPMGNNETTLRLSKQMSKYGSLVCGNLFYPLYPSYLNVVGVQSLDAVQGLTHYVENNTLTTRPYIYTLTLQWCYYCNVYDAPLRVAHNYGQLSGSEYVTVFFTGVRIAYATSKVHVITNNNFIGSNDYDLSNPHDAAFAIEVLQRTASADPLWNVDSGTINNTVVATNDLYGATVSFCRGCQVAQGATMLIVKNEIRRSNSYSYSGFSDATSLCQECTMANSGVFRIWNNSVDVRNSSVVEFVGLRDFDTYNAPFRMHRNAFIAYNRSVLPREFTATCGDYNTSEIHDDLFYHQEVCGNVMRAQDADQVSTYLVRGLYARSSVLVDINTVIQQDATTAYTYGCDGCFGEPLEWFNFVNPYKESVTDVSNTQPTAPAAGSNITRNATNATTATHSLPPHLSHTHRLRNASSETPTMRFSSSSGTISTSHSHTLPHTTTRTRLPAYSTNSGVLLNRNVMEVIRYTSVTHRLLSGGSTNNAAYTAWNNTLYSTGTQRAAVTMMHYTLCQNSHVLVAENLITDNSEAADAVINNATGSLDEMSDFCPVGVCGNTALLQGAQTSFSTISYGASAQWVDVIRNQVLLDDMYSAYATLLANSTASFATVIGNNVTATTSISTVLATESVQNVYYWWGSFKLDNNVVNATGRTADSYPQTIVHNASCTLPSGYYTVVCQNTFALRTDSFSAVLARSVNVVVGVSITNNSIIASGVQNATAIVAQNMQTGYQYVAVGALTVQDNVIAMDNMGDFTDTQDTCSARCGTGILAAQQAYYENGTVPLASTTTTNATMAASICYTCNTNNGALSVQDNRVTLYKAQRYHCNHCLGRVDISLSTNLASIHSGFTGRPQNTLAPSLVDAVLYTGSAIGDSTVIKNNEIQLEELEVSTCDATDFVGVCPSFYYDTYTANLVRGVVMGFGTYDSSINVQSNTILANVTVNNSFLLGSTAMVAVQVTAKPTTAIMTVQSNTMTLQGGSPQAFVCGGISDAYQSAYAISITGNTASAYGNETSIAACLGCSVSYQALTLTSNTLTAGKGTYGNGAICASCSANSYNGAITFGVKDNVLAFTNVETFRGIIAYLVSATYGTAVSIKENAIGASSGIAPTFTWSQTCPSSSFYICHNTISASYVSSVANTTICGSCSVSGNIYTTQSLTANYNQINVNSVDASYTVFYDGTFSGTGSTSNVVDNTVIIQNVVNTSIVPFQVSSSSAISLVANNLFVLNHAGSHVLGYLVGGPATSSGSPTDKTCINGNLVTTSSSGTATPMGPFATTQLVRATFLPLQTRRFAEAVQFQVTFTQRSLSRQTTIKSMLTPSMRRTLFSTMAPSVEQEVQAMLWITRSSFKMWVNTSIVPFQVSSSSAISLVANNLFVLNHAGSHVLGYLVGGPATSSGSPTDKTCINGNLVTTSSSGTATPMGLQNNCNTSVVSNTIRVYNGTGLGGWSMLGSRGATGVLILDANTIDNGIDINSVISSADPVTGLPTYTGGNANFILTNNNFPGKNVSVGVGGGSNTLTLSGGTVNYVVLSGSALTANSNTQVVLTSVTLQGLIFGGGLGSSVVNITGGAIHSNNAIAFAAATISNLIMNLMQISVSASRGFQVLTTSPIYLLSVVNSTVTTSSITTTSVTQDLQSGALIYIQNGTLSSSNVSFETLTFSNGGILVLDGANTTDSIITILDATFTGAHDLMFVEPSASSIAISTTVNITGSTFTAALSNTYYAENFGDSTSSSVNTLGGFSVYYDTSALLNFSSFHQPSTPNYLLQLACTSFDGMRGMLMSHTAYTPYTRIKTFALFSWAGAQCFTFTKSQSPSNSTIASFSVEPSVTKQTESSSKSQSPTTSSSPSLSDSPSWSDSTSPTESDSPSETESATESTSQSPSTSLSPSHSVTPSVTPSPSASPTPSVSPSNSASPTSTATLLLEEEHGRLQLVIIATVVAGVLGVLALVAFIKIKFFSAATASAVPTHPDAVELGQVGQANCPTAV